MPSRTVAVVPLRAPGAGKTRLASALAPAERAALAEAMLADVLGALHEAVDDVLVAADGPLAARVAEHLGARVSLDPAGTPSLDAALEAATAWLPRGRDVLVVPADLPRLRAGDVRAVLAADAEVVVAPTTAGGTGALLRRPRAAIATAYGPGSALRHHQRALAAGVTAAWVDRDGFHHDVDTWTDLAALYEVELGPTTARLLPTLLGPPAATGSGDRLSGAGPAGRDVPAGS